MSEIQLDIPNIVVLVNNDPDYRKVIVKPDSNFNVNINVPRIATRISGSFISIAETAITSSYALTSSYSLNAAAGAGFPFSGSAVITGSLLVVPTGSIGGITGSLLGTASIAENITVIFAGTYVTGSDSPIVPTPSGGFIYVTNADFAISASHAQLATSASSVHYNHVTNKPTLVSSSTQINTGSFTGSFTGIFTGNLTGTSSNAVTASYALNASGGTGVGFPFSGSAVITGSLLVSSSGLTLIGRGVTGSVFGTSSYSLLSSQSLFATTASFALNAGGGSGVGFPFSGSAVITGSLLISGSGLRVTGSTDIVGALTATTKSFLIDHKKLPGKKLVYGVLEGAEHAVYARGKLKGSNIIKLPEEWEWLVDNDTITVQLTPIGSHQKLYVKSIDGLYITVEAGGFITQEINCYYLVHATRKDVNPLQTVV